VYPPKLNGSAPVADWLHRKQAVAALFKLLEQRNNLQQTHVMSTKIVQFKQQLSRSHLLPVSCIDHIPLGSLHIKFQDVHGWMAQLAHDGHNGFDRKSILPNDKIPIKGMQSVGMENPARQGLGGGIKDMDFALLCVVAVASQSCPADPKEYTTHFRARFAISLAPHSHFPPSHRCTMDGAFCKLHKQG